MIKRLDIIIIHSARHELLKIYRTLYYYTLIGIIIVIGGVLRIYIIIPTRIFNFSTE